MAAALAGKQIGEAIQNETVPKDFQRFGSKIDEIFGDIRELKLIYGDHAADISTGAIGVYSYMNRIKAGLKQFMALNRKFSLQYIDRSDILPLTKLASKVTGLPTCTDITDKVLDRI